MPAKKAGTAKVVTRAARRQITPALEPGSLASTPDGRTTAQRRRLLSSLQSVCNHYSNEQIPQFSMQTSRLDQWLQSSLNEEKTGFLSSFVDQASMIQSNLHYRLVGSKSLVQRTLDLLHASEGGEGFRKLIKMTALNFYSSNFGGAVYLDRTDPVIASYLPNSDKWYWSTPPVQAMYATDSTLFQPNSDYVYPYTYDGQPWSRYDFFRVVSMPSTVLKTWGVGRCPLYRCIQIARMTSALYTHVYDVLSPDSAKGIVTVYGMRPDEFLAALSGSEAVNEQDAVTRASGETMGDVLGDVVVLADDEQEIKVKFTTLSRIPDGFFVDQWVRWTLTSFATNLGFPLEEFIGMPSNSLLGQSGSQVEAGVSRGASKGGSDFKNSFQENLQAYVIPDSVLFQFAERDESAELSDLSIREKKATIIQNLFEATQLAIINKGEENQDTLIESRAAGEHIISKDEARQMLDAWDVLPIKLTNTLNADIIVDDSTFDLPVHRLRELRERVRETEQVKRMAVNPTDEPVVMYDSFVDRVSGFVQSRETVLWKSDQELTRPTNWAGVTLTGGTYDLALPGAYKRRVPSKKITAEMALDSEHASDIARILRKNMLAQIDYLNDSELSLDGFVRLKDLISKKDIEMLTSRIYALCQLGRDGIIGRRKIPDSAAAEIASENLRYAKHRCDKLVGGMLDGDVMSVIEEVLGKVPESTAEFILDPRLQVMPALEERLRPLAHELASQESFQAFAAGGQNAVDVLGIKENAQESL